MKGIAQEFPLADASILWIALGGDHNKYSPTVKVLYIPSLLLFVQEKIVQILGT